MGKVRDDMKDIMNYRDIRQEMKSPNPDDKPENDKDEVDVGDGEKGGSDMDFDPDLAW